MSEDSLVETLRAQLNAPCPAIVPETTEAPPIVEMLRAEWKAMQPEIVDLKCRINFMQGRLRHSLKKADALRVMIADYDDEVNAKQS